eukprot:PhM_4_TR390/c0_g2_i1/m.49634
MLRLFSARHRFPPSLSALKGVRFASRWSKPEASAANLVCSRDTHRESHGIVCGIAATNVCDTYADEGSAAASSGADKKFVCPQCGKGFRMQAALDMHITTRHTDGAQAAPAADGTSAGLSGSFQPPGAAPTEPPRPRKPRPNPEDAHKSTSISDIPINRELVALWDDFGEANYPEGYRRSTYLTKEDIITYVRNRRRNYSDDEEGEEEAIPQQPGQTIQSPFSGANPFGIGGTIPPYSAQTQPDPQNPFGQSAAAPQGSSPFGQAAAAPQGGSPF